MEKISFETFKRPNGHDEFLEWLETLPKKDSAKLLRTIEETEKNDIPSIVHMEIDGNLDV